MFGRYFQTAADMTGDELFGVLTVDGVDLGVACVVEQQVISDSRADEAFLDGWDAVYGMIDVKELAVVGVEVGSHLGMDARRALALVAKAEVAPVHGIHVG